MTVNRSSHEAPTMMPMVIQALAMSCHIIPKPVILLWAKPMRQAKWRRIVFSGGHHAIHRVEFVYDRDKEAEASEFRYQW